MKLGSRCSCVNIRSQCRSCPSSTTTCCVGGVRTSCGSPKTPDIPPIPCVSFLVRSPSRASPPLTNRSPTFLAVSKRPWSSAFPQNRRSQIQPRSPSSERHLPQKNSFANPRTFRGWAISWQTRHTAPATVTPTMRFARFPAKEASKSTISTSISIPTGTTIRTVASPSMPYETSSSR